jgi:hypothetical protein
MQTKSPMQMEKTKDEENPSRGAFKPVSSRKLLNNSENEANSLRRSSRVAVKPTTRRSKRNASFQRLGEFQDDKMSDSLREEEGEIEEVDGLNQFK